MSIYYLLAKFRFDSAENEPCKVCPIERCVPRPDEARVIFWARSRRLLGALRMQNLMLRSKRMRNYERKRERQKRRSEITRLFIPVFRYGFVSRRLVHLAAKWGTNIGSTRAITSVDTKRQTIVLSTLWAALSQIFGTSAKIWQILEGPFSAVSKLMQPLQHVQDLQIYTFITSHL